MAENIEKQALSLDAALAETRKAHGVNSVMLASDAAALKVVRHSCGIPSLDYQLGCGIPLGRSIQIYGSEHSGKTYLAMKIAASLQQRFPDKMVMWLDFEHTFDIVRASHIGVDLDRLLVAQPITAEESYDQVIELLPFICCVVTDSVAAINPEVEQVSEKGAEKGMGDKQMGACASVIGKFFRLWNTAIAPEHFAGATPTLVFCNQLRDNFKPYGKETKLPGGRALRHNCSVFIETKRGPLFTLKDNDPEGNPIVIGHEIEFAITKNNTFQPDKKGTFLLCTRPFSAGGYPVNVNEVDWPRDLVKYANYYEILEKRGANYYFGEEKVGTSKFAAQKRVFEDAELAANLDAGIRKEITKRYGLEAKKTTQPVAKAGKTSSGKFKRKDAAGVGK